MHSERVGDCERASSADPKSCIHQDLLDCSGWQLVGDQPQSLSLRERVSELLKRAGRAPEATSQDDAALLSDVYSEQLDCLKTANWTLQMISSNVNRSIVSPCRDYSFLQINMLD